MYAYARFSGFTRHTAEINCCFVSAGTTMHVENTAYVAAIRLAGERFARASAASRGVLSVLRRSLVAGPQ